MRVLAFSDLHVDFDVNRRYLQALSGRDFVDDVLLVAGDLGHRLQTVAWALEVLRRRFARVFFVPGNHELWVRDPGTDSLRKFERVLSLCDGLGIETRATDIDRVRILPLFSWYDGSLAPPGQPPPTGWADRHYCRWPSGLGCPAAHFASRNPSPVPEAGRTVITFSHFVPRADLLPPAGLVRVEGLHAVSGSRRIEATLRAAGAAVHVFGHTHIQRDVLLDGIRYVQHTLGYPREHRGKGDFQPRLVSAG